MTRAVLKPLALGLAAVAALAGCAERPEPAPVVYRDTVPRAAPARRPAQPAPPPVIAAAPAPDPRGVIDFGGYSAVVARPGDTVASIAQRVGLSAAALASYNGLPAGHVPSPGDQLILPASPTGAPAAVAAGAGAAAIETAALEPPAPARPAIAAPVASPPTASAPVVTAPAASAPIASAPVVATPAATAPAPAAAIAPAPAGGLDFSRIEAAIGGGAAPAATPATVPAAVVAPPAAATPPAAVKPAPAPAAAVVAAVTPPPAQTPPAARFAPPVSGPITRPYSRGAGGERSDGVDFSAPAGAPVSAAADGQIALVSESLGGLGTIVLIRHQNDLLTVYGRVDGVTVQKGDRVRRGQVIGAVAPGAQGREPALHFEVRQGADSVDPSRYLPG